MSKLSQNCYHCGEEALKEKVLLEEKIFCCEGCKTVYEILQENDLCTYYESENIPGISPKGSFKGKYAFLAEEQVAQKLLDFKDGDKSAITFFIPKIHCSACIWLLEQLYKLNPGIHTSQVNFPKKTVRLVFSHEEVNLQEVVELLAMIGYEPNIRMQHLEGKEEGEDKSLTYQLGVAGFCFGNIMLLSLPDYFQMDRFSFSEFHRFFGYINLLLGIPALFFSGRSYLIAAWKGIKARYINIDIPIALGMIVLFVRSAFEVLTQTGAGYFDSLAGLVFFLLLGRYFQSKTYETLSFERDYRSYFPIAVNRLIEGKEENIAVSYVSPGDRLLIRNQELIPADSILLKGSALIDNSFVTGESNPIGKQSGDTIYAGGRQMGEAIEVEVLKAVSQSYLTQLWNHAAFNKKQSGIKGITDRISKYFTIIILAIASLAAWYWWTDDVGLAVNVFTAVLIIACPCALALSAPFTLGNTLRIFGRNKLYLKNAEVIEQLSSLDHLVFDKTGTITVAHEEKVEFVGEKLGEQALQMVSAVLRNSSHPLSQGLYKSLSVEKLLEVENFQEYVGKGVEGQVNGKQLRLGSAVFVGKEKSSDDAQTEVWLSIDGVVKGCFVLRNKYRTGLSSLWEALKTYRLSLISGDNAGESKQLQQWFAKEDLRFKQKPEDKLNFVSELQQSGEQVMMIGDGLNDAGALKQSDVGIAISEDISAFSPACDGILSADQLNKLPEFLQFAKQSMTVVKWSFVISLLYNVVGLSFAVQGKLSPVVAAILMPLSSITVVVFVTVATNLLARKKSL